MSKKNKGEKCFYVRAYCTDCGKMIMESIPLSKRELLASWDNAVLNAPGIICDCAPKRCPNFHITLKIYHKGLDREFDPEELIPKPEKEIDLGLPSFLDETLKEMASK